MENTMTTTPGVPLSAESVKLLKAGDLLRTIRDTTFYSSGLVVRFHKQADMTGHWHEVEDIQSGQRWSMAHCSCFTFIGRPDADGWMSAEGVDLSGLSVEMEQRPDGLYFRLSTPSDQGENTTPASGSDGLETPPADPMERLVAIALSKDGVPHTTDPKETLGLDFKILNAPIFIEVKRMHSPRIAEQMSRADNVIAVQGKQAVTWFSSLFHNHASVVRLKREQERRKNEWREQALVTREAAEKERAGRLAAESQVAALTAALEGLLAGVFAGKLLKKSDATVIRYLGPTLGGKVIAARQALALKEGL